MSSLSSWRQGSNLIKISHSSNQIHYLVIVCDDSHFHSLKLSCIFLVNGGSWLMVSCLIEWVTGVSCMNIPNIDRDLLPYEYIKELPSLFFVTAEIYEEIFGHIPEAVGGWSVRPTDTRERSVYMSHITGYGKYMVVWQNSMQWCVILLPRCLFSLLREWICFAFNFLPHQYLQQFRIPMPN